MDKKVKVETRTPTEISDRIDRLRMTIRDAPDEAGREAIRAEIKAETERRYEAECREIKAGRMPYPEIDCSHSEPPMTAEELGRMLGMRVPARRSVPDIASPAEMARIEARVKACTLATYGGMLRDAKARGRS